MNGELDIKVTKDTRERERKRQRERERERGRDNGQGERATDRHRKDTGSSEDRVKRVHIATTITSSLI